VEVCVERREGWMYVWRGGDTGVDRTCRVQRLTRTITSYIRLFFQALLGYQTLQTFQHCRSKAPPNWF